MTRIHAVTDFLRNGRELPDIQPGELFVFPTETVYGVGARLSDLAGIEAIFRLKGREDTKPLALYLDDPQQLEQWVELDDRAGWLAERFLPGPLTLVLRPRSSFPDRVGTATSIGIRIPDHPLPRLLARVFGEPFVATSANFSGQEPAASFSEIPPEFLERIDHAFDDGRPGSGRATAVVDLTGPDPVILRSGDFDPAALHPPVD